jgi:hypothetical protein
MKTWSYRLAADRLGRQQLVVVLLLLCGGADVAARDLCSFAPSLAA